VPELIRAASMPGSPGWPARPASAYRLQLHAGFGFRAAAAQASYLADLGISHAYLSPILQAVPGSMHGYDVIDHSRLSADLGGEEEFREMAATFAGYGIGVIADVVPNHMAVPAPEYLNRQLWSVLRDGQESDCAHWFDIDWAAQDGQMLLPILAGPLRSCLDDFQLAPLSALPDPAARRLLNEQEDELVLRYHEHVLPLRPGTSQLPLPELLAAQAYRLDSWQAAAASLNWRRFFDITSLIAIRVEEPDVFAATHGVLLGLVAEGLIDGLRIDHPDGLADPSRYLQQLAIATSGCWVVAEKILGPDEVLPADWQCAGTTGYDSLAAIGALFTDPAGLRALDGEYRRFTGGPRDFAGVEWTAMREMAGQQLTAEVARLARLARDTGDPQLLEEDLGDLRFVLAELLAAMEVYRAYVEPGSPPSGESVRLIGDAADRARRRVPARLQPALDSIAGLLLGQGEPDGDLTARDQLITVFQQSSAAVRAKGVEDTAMYRWSRLISANEVGADPAHPGMDPADFHAFAARLARHWPATMTTLSTHDTKRQEDARARLTVLAESPDSWAREVSAWHDRAEKLAAGQLPDPDTEYLLWQTLVAAWPISADRLTGYLRKAMREAKTLTSWTDPDSEYEAGVLGLARAICADEDLADRIAAFVTWITPDASAHSLGAKLVQLTMPGVPDVYQGCELGGFSLVDPDNRRPVDFARRRDLLARLDEAASTDGTGADGVIGAVRASRALSGAGGLDAAKLLVCSRVLRLRRLHPDWFAGSYAPMTARGRAAEHAFAFCRSDACVTVATRLPAALRRAGGWQDTTLRLPDGDWQDVLTGAPQPGGEARLADLTGSLPVALLVRSAGEAAR
jgi:(1->4)-alpha-D-glucan 1-alpha-D-glucosylmutase